MMEFLDEKIKVICNELKKLTIKQSIPLTEWVYKEGDFIYPEDAAKDSAPWTKFDCQKDHWYGLDRHYWFKAECTVPEELDGKEMWLHVCTQIDEWDDGKNPQFLLFVNGEAIQGIDMNHRDVLLQNKAVAGQKMTLELQSYTGILHKEFNLIVYLQEADPQIRALYYDMVVPLESFDRKNPEDMDRMALTKALDHTANMLDLRTPYSDDFYKSLQKAQEYITKAVYQDMAGHNEIIASCIGHTHIDVAWWWTVAQTKEKVGRSFATVLKLMDEYPEYKFMSSQPQLYVFLKARYPELYAKIKERVKEKRWEPEGGMWVEADCNLTSGESLVRQFLFGKHFFKEEFGIDNRILWLPDVFGYSGALPQIMKKCGIDYFQTTKIAWNQYNKFPYDTLMWRGIDGTEVLTHMCTTVSIGQSGKDTFTTYNGMLHPDSIIGGWERYQQKELNNDILVSYGYGDGGGGPTRDMLETSLRMEKGIRGIPKVRQLFAGDYFTELEERVKDNPELPVWEGELYFEFHRGVYTSMARNKRSNRKAEYMMMDLELLSVLCAAMGKVYPKEKLDQMWKTILINQFHDILPGSAIHEVYEVTKEEYAQLDEQGHQMISACLKQLYSDSGETEKKNITVVNQLGFARDTVITIPANDMIASENNEVSNLALRDAQGNCYTVQRSADSATATAFVRNIPSKGSKTFELVQIKNTEAFEPNPAFTIDYADAKKEQIAALETPFYNICFDEAGMFTSLFDKDNDREVIQKDMRGNLLRMYEDKPIYYDDWNIDRFYQEKFWDVTDVSDMRVTENGPVRCTIQIERKISNSLIRQKIHFYAKNRRIDFETWVDWKDHQHLLKVHFPVDVHTDEASFDIQFGNLTRKVHYNTSWDVARFESCGQKWIDLSEGHYGVSILNDCKYGYSVKDGNMSLSLIKSGIEPNQTCDQEEHFFTYSLYPHAENLREGGTIQQAADLNQPCMVVNGGISGKESSFAGVDHRNVYLETIKAAEDGNGVILRMYEDENARTKFHVSLPGSDIAHVEECNCIEEKVKDMEICTDGFTDVIKPFEIKSYRVILK